MYLVSYSLRPITTNPKDCSLHETEYRPFATIFMTEKKTSAVKSLLQIATPKTKSCEGLKIYLAWPLCIQRRPSLNSELLLKRCPSAVLHSFS